MTPLRYGYFGGERERTFRSTNFDFYDADRAAGVFDIPVLEPCDFVPDDLIGFNYAKSAHRHDCGVHFFIDDYQFERVWNRPRECVSWLRNFSCVLTPDFSLYTDMPAALKIWNLYRSRLIGQMWQDAGLNVIPTLTWADEGTFDFCFEGLPEDSVVAVSTVGVVCSKEARELWYAGMDAAIERLRPSTVLCYGADIGYDFGPVKVKRFDRRKIADRKEGA